MARTPKHCRELLEQYENMRKYAFESINSIRTIPKHNLANWLSSANEEYYIGLAYGACSMLETALHSSKCYGGFSYIRQDGTLVPSEDIKSGNFTDWSRSYRVLV